MIKYRRAILTALLLALVILPRLASLRAFATLDEPFWLSVGANFYYALGQREFERTVYEYHPAVTTMWIVAVAMLAYFPEYRGLGQGYFDVDKNKFDPFLLEHGRPPLNLLYDSRLIQLAIIVVLALIVFYLLSILIDDGFAFLATGFITSSPFFLGHSILLNHEGMLALFVLISVLGLVAYLERGRKMPYLLLSAAGASLAQLTKSSAIGLLPVTGLILAYAIYRNSGEKGLWQAAFNELKTFGIWFITLALIYFVVWPGMWVAPGRMLYEVYGNAFSYAFQGARLQVTETLQPSEFSLDDTGAALLLFLRDVAWRTTPIAWAGVLMALAGFALPRERFPAPIIKHLIVYLFLAAAIFLLLFSMARGRNSLHYIMTSFVGLDGIAALGWGIWLGWLADRWRLGNKEGIVLGLQLAVIGVQFSQALIFSPYYYTYHNPIISWIRREIPSYGYGEGMELAAAYLASKPDAENLTVFGYHSRGPFSYFFPGQTLILNPVYLDQRGMPDVISRLEQADYLVFYESLASRSHGSRRFTDALMDTAPEAVISVQGLENILIYQVSDLTPEFYEQITE